MCEVSIAEAKGSLRVKREKRGRRRRKGREGGREGGESERERERERERASTVGRRQRDKCWCSQRMTPCVGRQDHGGQGEGGSQHMHQRGWPSITGLLCQRLPCFELGLDARNLKQLKGTIMNRKWAYQQLMYKIRL